MRAKLIENAKEPAAGVSFKLLHQRKRKADSWEDVDAKKLNTLKADEGVAIALSSEEAFDLAQRLCDLQAIKDRFGVPYGNTYFIGVRHPPEWGTMFGGKKGPSLIVPTDGTGTDVAEALKLLFSRDDLGDLAAVLGSLSPQKVSDIRAGIGLSVLDQLLAEWDEAPDNPSEEHWQSLFAKYPFALEQIFHVPTVLLKSKAYVGGKTFDNKGGKLPDFLLETKETHASVAVEIKTPKTLLLHPTAYRSNAFRAGEHLSGSVVQVLTYRDTLMEQMSNIAEDSDLMRRVLPKCAVIIGHSNELDSKDKSRCFDRIRARGDVTVLTFDEVYDRLVGLKTIMASLSSEEEADVEQADSGVEEIF